MSLTFGVSTLAIAGVPFFSGFFSKDAILAFADGKGPRVGRPKVLDVVLPRTRSGAVANSEEVAVLPLEHLGGEALWPQPNAHLSGQVEEDILDVRDADVDGRPQLGRRGGGGGPHLGRLNFAFEEGLPDDLGELRVLKALQGDHLAPPVVAFRQTLPAGAAVLSLPSSVVDANVDAWSEQGPKGERVEETHRTPTGHDNNHRPAALDDLCALFGDRVRPRSFP
ncbi:MAG: hypothetical protein AAFU79_33070 [Myxococcota bacterium]